ncbi:MAG TPA: GAF domain-containing protein [Terriglobales bacterium]|nr:GAF domain-containing protein [Terriglobales bacterium]
MFGLNGLEKLADVKKCVPGRISVEIARMFGVQSTDVGLLWVEEDKLIFLYPVELQSAGSIPLTSSAIAAQSARGRRPLYFNNFPQVPHHTSFERIVLNNSRPLSEMPDPIQKIMSVPIVASDGVLLGVIQVCRKGMTPAMAGPDFTENDLQRLIEASRLIATLQPELDAAKSAEYPMLHFRNNWSNGPRKASA